MFVELSVRKIMVITMPAGSPMKYTPYIPATNTCKPAQNDRLRYRISIIIHRIYSPPAPFARWVRLVLAPARLEQGESYTCPAQRGMLIIVADIEARL